MKKLVAIFFLSLICLATVSSRLKVSDIGYALAADSEECESEPKGDKKAIKEFTTQADNKPCTAPGIIYRYKAHQVFIFPQPVLDKQTPPPDATC